MKHFFFASLVALTLVGGCSNNTTNTTDAFVAADTGGTDGGALDTGVIADTGTVDDTGTTPDMGPIADTGTTPDMGPVADTGTAADTGTGADGCTPRADESPLRGSTCAPGTPTCPPGYVCQLFSGIVAQYRCEIPCPSMMDCECPNTLTCQPSVDKAGTHYLCM